MGSHLSDVWFRTTDLEVVSGSGCVVRTADGAEYLDFTAGIAVASTGHCHPRVVDAIREQAGQIIHAQVNCYRSPLPEQLADAPRADHAVEHRHVLLHELRRRGDRSRGEARAPRDRPAERDRRAGRLPRPHVPDDGDDHVEGRRARRLPAAAGRRVRHVVPAAVRVGRRRGDRGRARARRPSPAARHADRAERDRGVRDGAGARRRRLPPRAGRVRARRRARSARSTASCSSPTRCRPGFARTGRMFAVEHSGVEPDIMVMAKGIASGFPIAAIGAPAELMARWSRGRARRHLRREPDRLRGRARDHRRDPRRAARRPARRRAAASCIEGLRALQSRHAGVGDVRGLGLMVAAELTPRRRLARRGPHERGDDALPRESTTWC